jgi:MFS transporter, DHA1 family, multidrug resistance protein
MKAEPHASLRVVAPMAGLTAAGMLATDLMLPAVPSLQAELGVSIAAGQATLSIFLLALAASQLLWGEVFTRHGPRRTAVLGTLLLLAGTAACALAQDIVPLLLGRFVQGLGAGAAMVVAPSVIRATLPAHEATRGLGWVAMMESLVPACGPVLGAALLLLADWRGLFWALLAATLLITPWALAATPRVLPGVHAHERASHAALLCNPAFTRPALAHALAFAALFSFVASAPQMLRLSVGWGPGGFAALQALGVAAFLASTWVSGRLSHREPQRYRPEVLARAGAWGQALLTTAWALAGLWLAPGGWFFGGFWLLFCALLGVRGPATMALALSLPAAQMGRAAALLMLAVLGASALATQAVAPWLASAPVGAVALCMAACCAASLWVLGRPTPGAGGS